MLSEPGHVHHSVHTTTTCEVCVPTLQRDDPFIPVAEAGARMKEGHKTHAGTGHLPRQETRT